MKIKIGELSRLTGTPVPTIVTYEKEGLFQPDFRTGGNIRLYNDSAIEELRFIRICKKTGMPTATIKGLIALRKAPQAASKADTQCLEDAFRTLDDLNSCLLYLKKELAPLEAFNAGAENPPA